MSSIVATSGLQPYQADVALRMIYTPAMTYSLPAVNVSEKILNKIQAKSLESFVPALGYNRNFPRAVILGPKEFGGEGVPHLHTESNIQKLEIIMSNVRGQTELGTLFRINLSWIHLLVGRGEQYLMSHYDIPYVNTWFSSIRQFLIQINGRLSINDLFLPSLEITGDIFIMEALANIQPKLSANQMRYLYNWRFYFQVNTLSDLCNAKGDAIMDSYLKYPTATTINQIRSERKSKLQWPVQPPPSSTSTFKLWVRYLRLCFLRPSGQKLRTSLGKWNTTPSNSNSSWHAYMSPKHTEFIVCTNSNIFQYKSILSCTPGTTTFDNTSRVALDRIPLSYIPVDYVCPNPQTFKVLHTQRAFDIPSTVTANPDSDLQAVIAEAPDWQRYLLQHFRIHDLPQLIDCLMSIDIKLYSVSDGGLKDQKGSFGVAFGTIHEELFCIEGPAPGFSEHANSFRSEAYGLLAAINFLCLLLKTYNIILPKDRKLYMFCDNLSVVNVIRKVISHQTYPRMFTKSDSDIILQIASDINHLQAQSVHIILEHVKGHQDDHQQYHELSRESQFNVNADEYATNYILSGEMIPYIEVPANPVNLYINDNIMNRDVTSEIRKASRSPELRKYLIDRFDWHKSTPDLIWWTIHGSTIKSFPFHDRRRIRKIIFGWLPTCERLNMYNDEVADTCPSCKTCIETNEHIYKCYCDSRTIIKNRWLESFDAFLLNKKYTPPMIRDIFFNKVKGLITTDSIIVPTNIPSQFQQSMTDQKAIGWDQLLSGRLAYSWSTIIADHLSSQKVDNREMSPLVWGRRIVRLLFTIMLQLWHQRNLDGHMLTPQKESDLTRTRLLQRIQYLQQSNPEVPHHHRDFVFRSFDIIETYSVSNLRSWLKMAENIIRLHKRRRQAPTDISQFWISQPDDPDQVPTC